MKRIISLILVLTMLTVTFTACSQGSENAAEDSKTAEAVNPTAEEVVVEDAAEAEVVTDDLPERTFDGFAYNIYTRISTTHYKFCVEEMNGEVLNDAIFERNSKLCDRFDITMAEEEYSDENLASNNVLSGDDTFSLMNVRCTQADSMARKSYCYDISSLQYIDLDKPYWDKELTHALAVGSRYYTAIGYSTLTTVDFMDSLLFNKDLLKQYPSLGNPYEMVREGTWTFDRFGEMSEAVLVDVNGDGKMDANDQWGQLGASKFHQCSFIQAGGVMYISKDENNYPVFDMLENEHFIEVWEKTFAVCNFNNAWYATSDGTNEAVEYHNMFRNGQGLFLSTMFYYIESLRDMDYDFGIVPYPKYDENQSKYYNRIAFFDTSVIPVTVSDIDCSSMVLEAMNCESFNTVMPAYKDIALKSKYARDEDSSEMIDIIMNNRIIDFGDTYYVGNIRDSYITNMFITGNTDLVSKSKGTVKAVNKMLEKMINEYTGESDG